MELHRDSEQLQRVQRQSRWSRRIRLGLVGLQLKKQVCRLLLNPIFLDCQSNPNPSQIYD